MKNDFKKGFEKVAKNMKIRPKDIAGPAVIGGGATYLMNKLLPDAKEKAEGDYSHLKGVKK